MDPYFEDLSGEALADSDGRLHHLIGAPITGGQGAVYSTREPGIGLKVFKRSTGGIEVVQRVRRLPIEDLSAIAAPLAALQDRDGYVMVWLRGMVPIRDIRLPSGGTERDVLGWYLRTGGLRRRVEICARLAAVIADLHARGLVYVDLNLTNAMVSEAVDSTEVRLIDLDNLRLASEGSLSFLTESFAAPEMFSRVPPSFASDAYSLAIVIFNTLVGYHPFEDGDLVRNSPDGSPERLRARHGLLPSFVDPDDQSNQTDRYLLPLDAVLTSELLAAFQQCFGPGRKDHWARPSAAVFARLLWEAVDNTIRCSCGFTSYRYTSEVCPFCGAAFDDALKVHVRLSRDVEPNLATVVVGTDGATLCQRHLPIPIEPRERLNILAKFRRKENGIEIEPSPRCLCSANFVSLGDHCELTTSSGSTFTLGVSADAD